MDSPPQFATHGMCIRKVGKGCLRKSYADHVDDISKKGQKLSIRNRRACMKRLMDGSEARQLCKDHTFWKSISLCLPFWEIDTCLLQHELHEWRPEYDCDGCIFPSCDEEEFSELFDFDCEVVRWINDNIPWPTDKMIGRWHLVGGRCRKREDGSTKSVLNTRVISSAVEKACDARTAVMRRTSFVTQRHRPRRTKDIRRQPARRLAPPARSTRRALRFA
ncbi:hypothetical protein EVAR_47666_1 [Eumeta japonica]|uniref:Uncharacterized protein n=1 Tax=Eumeta variegata TaxID=151549 RepID=A0A4C1XZK5_EUMVA|nr:hypothetical protein EVAR_47666_1 [Eumeta japonica]